MNTSALLDFSDLPLFDRITPEQVAPAVDELLARANAALEQVTQPDFPADWSAIARVLDVATEHLGRAWGAVNHLNSVMDTPQMSANIANTGTGDGSPITNTKKSAASVNSAIESNGSAA